MNKRFEQKISDYKKRSEKKSKKEKLPTKEASAVIPDVPVALPVKETEKPKKPKSVPEPPKPDIVPEKNVLSKKVDEILQGLETEKSRYGGRQKIDIKFINDKARRGVTFSKRKSGMMKKAQELAVLTGADVLLVISTNPGKTVFTYASDNFKTFLEEQRNRDALLSCLKTKEENEGEQDKSDSDD